MARDDNSNVFPENFTFTLINGKIYRRFDEATAPD